MQAKSSIINGFLRVIGTLFTKKIETTDNISYNMHSSTQIPFKVYGGDANGQGISVGAGGATIVGSGESAKTCEPLLPATNEELWLASDGLIKIYTGCQTIGNKAGLIISNTRQFYPDTNNTGTLGTSGNKWNNIYATTITGNLVGNSSTATKLQTPRQINGTNFDGSANITTAKWGNARTVSVSGAATGSVDLDGSANKTLSLLRRGASVGQSSTVVADKPWYKFASVSIDADTEDREIAFKVSNGYGLITASGILRARIRTDKNAFRESSVFYWEYANSGIDPNKFVMVYNTGTKPTICELWCKCDGDHSGYQFAVISETTRTARNDTLWTLYTTWSAGSQTAPTSGYTQLVSSYLTIKNPISGNAATATKLQTARTITFTGDVTGNLTFDGSSNVSAKLSYGNLPKSDTFLSNITVATSSFTNLVATISNAAFTANSVVDVYFAEASIPVAQKARITVNSLNGSLQLKVAKLPTANLVIESIRISNKS